MRRDTVAVVPVLTNHSALRGFTIFSTAGHGRERVPGGRGRARCVLSNNNVLPRDRNRLLSRQEQAKAVNEVLLLLLAVAHSGSHGVDLVAVL